MNTIMLAMLLLSNGPGLPVDAPTVIVPPAFDEYTLLDVRACATATATDEITVPLHQQYRRHNRELKRLGK